MTTLSKTLILTECKECGEEVRQVKLMFQQGYHRWEELTIRGISTDVHSSESIIHYEGYCRNCDFVSLTQEINLN